MIGTPSSFTPIVNLKPNSRAIIGLISRNVSHILVRSSNTRVNRNLHGARLSNSTLTLDFYSVQVRHQKKQQQQKDLNSK